MAQPHRDPTAHASEHAPDRPRLRAVGVVCDRCGHEESLEHARLGGWHVSRDGQHVVCQSCVEVYALELDDVVLYFPACGHAIEDDAVLYAPHVCRTCAER
jgi:predicted RNA-binding Zn-ribbon protein involved in translation (DUF1610 family)